MWRKGLIAVAIVGVVLTHVAFADIRHVVALQYKAGVDDATKAQIAQEFIRLKDHALRDGRPYIVSILGGPAISKEGFDRNLQWAFIVTFKTEADRDFFVGPPYRKAMDPVHEALAKRVVPLIEADAAGNPSGLFVFDFATSGQR